MNCQDAQGLIADFAESGLDAGRRGAFQRHLRECAACAADSRAWGSVSDALAALPHLTPPSGFNEAILASLDLPVVAARPPRVFRWVMGILGTMGLVWMIVLGVAIRHALTHWDRVMVRHALDWAVAGTERVWNALPVLFEPFVSHTLPLLKVAAGYCVVIGPVWVVVACAALLVAYRWEKAPRMPVC